MLSLIAYNYTFSPNTTSQKIQIGAFALSIGSIGVATLLAFAGFVLAVMLLHRKRVQEEKNIY